MAISNITNSYVNNTTTSANTKKTPEKKTDTTETTTTPTEDAVVYEKETEETTDASKKIYQPNTDVINQLKADAERRTSQLRQLVEKMLLKQGTTFTETMDMFQLIKNGQLEVDPETAPVTTGDITPINTGVCTKAKRVIRDQFQLRLRGTHVQPEGFAAEWAFNN